MENDSGEQLEHLRELIQRHEVCWEVSPIKSGTTDGETLHVGYELLLAGIFNDPERAADTMRDKLEVVLEALRELATDLEQHAGLPEEHRIKRYDEGLQTSPKREHRPEAKLKLGLLHREAFHEAADEKLAQSVQLLESRLKTLGASKGNWER
jgi:hypothetical protein